MCEIVFDGGGGGGEVSACIWGSRLYSEFYVIRNRQYSDGKMLGRRTVFLFRRKIFGSKNCLLVRISVIKLKNWVKVTCVDPNVCYVIFVSRR